MLCFRRCQETAAKEARVEERRLSLSQAADALDISERTAYRWVKSGKLRAYKPGRDYWIPESAVTEIIEKSLVRPKAPGRSPSEPSFNDVLAEERRTGYQRSWRDYITDEAERIASQADSKGYAPEWMRWVSETPRRITRVLFDNGVLGKRETYPTEAEWRQSWEIFDALDELNQAVEQAWRAQMRESEHLERRREADELRKKREADNKIHEAELGAIRDERRTSA